MVGRIGPRPDAGPQQQRRRGGEGRQLTPRDRQPVAGVGPLVGGQERRHGDGMQCGQDDEDQQDRGQAEPDGPPVLRVRAP
jgi:hypothetical protein